MSVCVSCSEEEIIENEDNSTKITTLITDIGNVVPYLVQIDDNQVIVGLSPYAQLFYLNLSTPESEEQLKLLNAALKEEIPLKVSLFENTNNIYSIKSISTKEIKEFVESKKNRDFNLSSSLIPYRPQVGPLKGYIWYYEIQNVFNILKSSRHIPFDYTKDGCWARAHKMVQILNELGYKCEKQWIIGNLGATSVNNANCCIEWGFHVAPVIKKANYGKNSIEYAVYVDVVMDPSLFNEPVTVDKWEKACLKTRCNPKANVIYTRRTASEIYKLPYEERDDDYSKTNQDLEYYRSLPIPCK